MLAQRRRRFLRSLLVAACAAGPLALGSCGPSPTGPEPRPPVHRMVTVTVHDSLGEPAVGSHVMLTLSFDSEGMAAVVLGDADAAGEVSRVLEEGAWLAYTGGGGTAAGGGFVVAGEGRAAADTQVVRLVLRASSRATGLARLAGRTDHRDILVGCVGGGLQTTAVTDSTGAYALEDLPPGHWTITCEMFGFKQGVTAATIPAPGSAVTVPTVTMLSDP